MPTAPRLVVVGAGGHAISVADAILSLQWTLEGFYSPDGAGPAESLGSVFPSLESLDFDNITFVPGIGANYARETALESLLSAHPGARLASVVHSTAWVSPHATIEPGAVVLSHAHVGPQSVLRRGALLNTGASLDHESSIGDFGSLGPGARTGGNVEIGPRTMVGMQAGILQGIAVGADTVIGAHSLVNRDIGDNLVAWGTPAKVVRNRSREDPYY